jgi:ribosomal protein S20
MNGWIKIGVSAVLVVMLMSLERTTLAAPDVNEAKKQSTEMVKNAQQMVEHGNAAHPDVMTKYAKAMIASAQKVLDNIPPGNKHGETAAGHIKTAIEQAKVTIADQGVDSAEQALNHAMEGDKHVQEM